MFNIANAVILAFVGLFDDRWARRRKKEILRNRLSRDGWKWRSFESLRRAIREDEDKTRELLIEIGARANTKIRDSWTLD
jgi:hypothetical protein